MAKIYVIHENLDWTVHLTRQLEARGLPYGEWFLDKGAIDLTQEPPHGVFDNRMGASSHTRGHRYALELTAAVLAWLERHGRPISNGTRALQLAQYMALSPQGIRTPRTIAAVGLEQTLYAARSPLLQEYIQAPEPYITRCEFIRDRNGTIYTYDVNTNTNDNPDAEAAAGRSGMGAIADFLSGELSKLQERTEPLGYAQWLLCAPNSGSAAVRQPG